MESTGPHLSHFYGNGKVLLTSEYYVLDGALAIGLPVQKGQHLDISYKTSFSPRLIWKSVDFKGQTWLECEFEFWHFNLLKGDESCPHTAFIQQVLRQARKQNPHFLRDDVEVTAVSRCDFPMNWGLGSSSSLIYNIAQWAYTSAFEMNSTLLSGSGYDIACAGAQGPIQYQIGKKGATWSPVEFTLGLGETVYFIFQGQKKKTRDAINHYHQVAPKDKKTIIKELSAISRLLVKTNDAQEFQLLVREHENIISTSLKMPSLQETQFSDFPGVVKSLGAWGGDFALVISDRGPAFIKQYFEQKGHDVIFAYKDFILDPMYIKSETVPLGVQ